MITVTVSKKNNSYISFVSEGHAGYAEEGQDIICAAVSALVINTVNSLEAFTTEQFETEAEVPGEIAVRLEHPAGHDADLLMRSLVLGLQGIQTTYGDEYIVLDFREV